MTPTFETPHERFCFETATHFTAVRGRGQSRRREQFTTFQDAWLYAAEFEGKLTMIYAINDLGNSAHICNA